MHLVSLPISIVKLSTRTPRFVKNTRKTLLPNSTFGCHLVRPKLRSSDFSQLDLPSDRAACGGPSRSSSRCKTCRQSTVAEAASMGATEAPYGAWASPLKADVVTAGAIRLGGAAVDSAGCLLWVEGRPAEGGRNVIVVRGGLEPGKPQRDLTPSSYNVRTRVHEYGGGALLLAEDSVIFSNFADQRLYKQSLVEGSEPQPVTPASDQAALRYADGVWDSTRQRVICVREDHREAGKEARNEIVAIDLRCSPEEGKVLVTGHDFVAFPRLSPDGNSLAWVTWSHPNMPWDRTQLWVAQVTVTGDLTNQRCIAGAESDAVEAPTEPKWSTQGELFFVSDRNSGFWNLYRWDQGKESVEPVYTLHAEFTHPAWLFGNSSYAFVEGEEGDSLHIVASYQLKGLSKLGIIDLATKTLSSIETPYTDIASLFQGPRGVFLTGAAASLAPSVVQVELNPDLKSGKADKVLYNSSSLDLSSLAPYLSTPESIAFPTVDGETAYAIYYPPQNQDFVAPGGDKPPLLVRSHGGPTAATGTALKLGIQYWTSRGWAVADVNYRGSTGYGRAYREKLYGTWGIVDIDDCCSCAERLVTAGLVDGKRLAIDGGSAGGYTTLAVLAFRETFKAGCSFYGVSDLMILAKETHKFESRYLDQLLGPLATSEQVYQDRSPINSTDKISCPLILFQGLEDKVVPPNQTRMMYEAVKQKGIPVALIEYEGEQHGFRKAENIKRTLEHEMLFFSRVLGGFELADPVDPLHIDNLDSL